MDPDAVVEDLRKKGREIEHERVAKVPYSQSLDQKLQPDMANLRLIANSRWLHLLFDREYALLMNELFALRERLIGSSALIAMVKDGRTPDQLGKAIAERKDLHWTSFRRISDYVQDAAYGAAGMEFKGFIPKTSKVRIVPFVTALKAKPVDWAPFWQYVKSERAQGALKLREEWLDQDGKLSATLQATLDTLSKRFNELVHANGQGLFPQDDHARKALPLEITEQALSLIHAPAESIPTKWNEAEGIPASFLKEAYSQGQLVRKALATAARKRGNEHYGKLAGALEAGDKQRLRVLCRDAFLNWTVAMRDIEQSATVAANWAALQLTMFDYEETIKQANTGLAAVEAYKREPISYTDRRALTIKELESGVLAVVPAKPYRTLTAEQKRAHMLIVRKLYLRRARGEVGLCLQLMVQPNWLDNKEASDQIYKLHDEAIQSYEAGFLLEPRDRTPKIDRGAFELAYETRLLECRLPGAMQKDIAEFQSRQAAT